MMLRPYINGTKRDVVVAVQKSGFAWALDRNNGSLVWSTEVGPGGILGGGSWGAATDKKRVYTNIINNGGKNFTLKPSNNVTTSGGWAAMDPRSGEVLWSTANPSNAFSAGPVSVANGVLFGGSTDANGTVYAMNTRTGDILWSYETGATVYGGMSISNGRYAFKETKISPETVAKLRLKWKFYAGDHITATPAIYDNSLYFPSWNGYIYAVRASDGSLIWKKNLLTLTGLNTNGFVYAVNTTISRSTPTIAGDRGDLLMAAVLSWSREMIVLPKVD
ncbi:hypothetical protein ACLB2K_058016 [Fragaria x ananassa]